MCQVHQKDRITYRSDNQVVSTTTLQDVLEKQSKKLIIQLDIDKVNDKKIEELSQILKGNEGNVPTNFVVYDLDEQVKLNLHSRSVKVNVTNELLEVLKKEQIHFKLN